jgi:hypothetical protein
MFSTDAFEEHEALLPEADQPPTLAHVIHVVLCGISFVMFAIMIVSRT